MLRGIVTAVRARTRVFAVVLLTVLGVEIIAPPVVLSLARKPLDYFTFNAWLVRLPEYLWHGPGSLTDHPDKLAPGLAPGQTAEPQQPEKVAPDPQNGGPRPLGLRIHGPTVQENPSLTKGTPSATLAHTWRPCGTSFPAPFFCPP